MAKPKEFETVKASRDIHHGGHYTVKNGKAVKEQAEKKEAK